MDMPHFFIHSLIDGHLDCFHFGAVMNNAVVNIQVRVFMGNTVLVSMGLYNKIT